MKHGSLFSGIGGFDLAAEWIGWENIFHCEIDPFCQKILNYYWNKAKSYEDIKKTDFTIHRGKCHILTGGFPCQPFSTAGKRKGTEDDRYLWDEYLRAIREIQPHFVVAENVTGILSMEEREMFFRVDGRKRIRLDYIDEYEAVYTRQASLLLNSICEDLEKEGYSVQPVIIPAAGIGAPHKRDRIWIVAYSNSHGHSGRRFGFESDRSTSRKSYAKQKKRKWVRDESGRNDDTKTSTNTSCERCNNGGDHREKLPIPANKRVTKKNKQEREGWFCRTCSFGEATTNSNQFNGNVPGFRTGEISQFKTPKVFKYPVTNPHRPRWKKLHNPDFSEKSGFNSGICFPKPTYWETFPTQSPVCDGNDGISTRLDGITFSNWRNQSIKGGGNAIVPQVVFEIFKAIQHFIDETT